MCNLASKVFQNGEKQSFVPLSGVSAAGRRKNVFTESWIRETLVTFPLISIDDGSADGRGAQRWFHGTLAIPLGGPDRPSDIPQGN